jgi:hypothetical protein
MAAVPKVSERLFDRTNPEHPTGVGLRPRRGRKLDPHGHRSSPTPTICSDSPHMRPKLLPDPHWGHPLMIAALRRQEMAGVLPPPLPLLLSRPSAAAVTPASLLSKRLA